MGYEKNVRLNSGVECRHCYNWNTLHPLHTVIVMDPSLDHEEVVSIFHTTN